MENKLTDFEKKIILIIKQSDNRDHDLDVAYEEEYRNGDDSYDQDWQIDVVLLPIICKTMNQSRMALLIKELIFTDTLESKYNVLIKYIKLYIKADMLNN